MRQTDQKSGVENLKTSGPPFRFRLEHTLDLDTIIITSNRLTLKPVSREYAETIFAEYTPKITRSLMTEASGRIEDTFAFIEKSALGRAQGSDLPR